MKSSLTFLLLFMSIPLLYGQSGKIIVSGHTQDAFGTLPGVSIIIVGTPYGTSSDSEGHFSIELEPNQVLEFSFIGYKNQSYIIQQQKVLNIVLEEDQNQLDELVIEVPYGTANKNTYTGSVGVISSKTIEQSQVSNVSKVLQGSIAGVQSFSSSGQPGSEATIRIRGVGSINASSNPLYVVDGVPYEGGLNAIASFDIASISVLKDATAATLYGSRAANGVILITTKAGKFNQTPKINISIKKGFSSRALADYKQVNTQQYFEMYWEALRNGIMDSAGADPVTAAQYASANLVPTLGINPYGTQYAQPVGVDGKLNPQARLLWNDNWEQALTTNAQYTDINVNISGGSELTKYFISAGYLDDQGYVLSSGFERMNLRSNLSVQAKDWLEVGLNLSAAHSVQNYPKQDDSAINNVIGFARAMPSFYPIYQRNLETGAYLIDQQSGKRIYDFGSYRATSYANYNLLATLPLDKNDIIKDVASIRGFAQANILDNLTYKTSLSVDYSNTTNHNVANGELGVGVNDGGSIALRNTKTTSVTYNNVFNYNMDFQHPGKLALMVGQEYYSFDSNYFGGLRQMIIAQGFDQPDAASVLADFFGKADQYKMLSFFGNAQYSYDDKYFFSTSYRRDGSSRFAKENRWGDFWSVGASWRIIDEDFMKKAKDNYLSNLLFKVSYGAQGNDNIGYYAYQSLYAIYNNLGEGGLVSSRLETPELSWETNLNLNIGLDFGFLNNRLSGTITYFSRDSKDLLFDQPMAPSLGFEKIQTNVGKIKNYGWELTLDANVVNKSDWQINTGLNLTTYKNKISSLASEEIYNGLNKWTEGGSIYDFYLKQWAGVNPLNGNAQWYIQNSDGTKTATEDYSRLSDKDRVKAGSSLPDLTGGFYGDITYKSWSLNMNFTYTIGGKIYDQDKLSLMGQKGAGNTWSTEMLNRWTPENPNTDVARLTTNAQSNWTSSSDRFLIDRSFLKLKTVTLSYNFTPKWLDKMNIASASLFMQGENLFTLTKNQGIDPEQNFAGTTYYRYPMMKTISLGLNVTL